MFTISELLQFFIILFLITCAVTFIVLWAFERYRALSRDEVMTRAEWIQLIYDEFGVSKRCARKMYFAMTQVKKLYDMNKIFKKG